MKLTKLAFLLLAVMMFLTAAGMTALAEEPPGSHIHYDDRNSLEEGSTEMIIEKLP